MMWWEGVVETGVVFREKHTFRNAIWKRHRSLVYSCSLVILKVYCNLPRLFK